MAKRGRPSNAERAAREAAALAAESSPAPAVHPGASAEAAVTEAAGLDASPTEAEIRALFVDPASSDDEDDLAPPPTVAAPPPPAEQDLSLLSASDRENPLKLHGQALRDFANRRGIARSEMVGWTDDKVREQAKIVTYRQYGYAHFAEV